MPTWSSTPTQAAVDAQIARLILALYDNIESNYDWRKLYFTGQTSTSVWPNNGVMYSSGTMAVPAMPGNTSSYHINYDAIMNWIKTIGPNPFPPNLRCGRIVYYDYIPSTISMPTPADRSQRFWKDYIDFVLAFTHRTNTTTGYQDSSSYTGYGSDFTWTSASTSTAPSDTNVVAIRVRSSGGTNTDVASYPRLAPYQNYGDSPRRPKTRMWFGPMTMTDFIVNTNLGNPFNGSRGDLSLCPGACHQSQSISCKLGVRAALYDCRINHPNDMVSLIFFSGSEMNSVSPKRFRTARYEMGNDYDKMVQYLFFPPSTITNPGTEIGWDDPDFNNVPAANGGTCYDLPLMLAYNQFSSNSSLLTANSGQPNGNAGGLGRNTAQKIVILETDGVANTKCDIPTFQTVSPGNNYYHVRQSDSINLTSTGWWSTTNLLTIAEKLGADTSLGGYSTSVKPLKLHCVGFGYLFEPTFTDVTERDGALDCFKQIQQKGNVNDNDGYTTLYPGSQIADYKIITGNAINRVTKMRKAFTRILQEESVTVSLIE
jgi:hypothetical protein